MMISNIFLITAGENLSKNQLKKAIEHDLKPSKDWIRSVPIKIEPAISAIYNQNQDNKSILFGFQELKDFDFKAPRYPKSPKSLFLVLNRSHNLCAFGLLNKRLVDLSGTIPKEELILDNIPDGGVVRILVKQTRAGNKGSVEIFYPSTSKD